MKIEFLENNNISLRNIEKQPQNVVLSVNNLTNSYNLENQALEVSTMSP